MKLKSFNTIGLAALAVAGISALVSAQAPPAARGHITLSMAGGNCVKTMVGNDGGSRIRAKRGAAVQWDVTNNCSADASVAVGDFAIKGGSGDNPFVAGRTSCSAAPGGKSCMITLTVRGNAAINTYTYAVSVNGKAQDPDLIIEGV
jgi:FtsP/CotA-like multicopper oxidase with cupredoxin domain